jgi:hypothetical protein
LHGQFAALGELLNHFDVRARGFGVACQDREGLGFGHQPLEQIQTLLVVTGLPYARDIASWRIHAFDQAVFQG